MLILGFESIIKYCGLWNNWSLSVKVGPKLNQAQTHSPSQKKLLNILVTQDPLRQRSKKLELRDFNKVIFSSNLTFFLQRIDRFIFNKLSIYSLMNRLFWVHQIEHLFFNDCLFFNKLSISSSTFTLQETDYIFLIYKLKIYLLKDLKI